MSSTTSESVENEDKVNDSIVREILLENNPTNQQETIMDTIKTSLSDILSV